MIIIIAQAINFKQYFPPRIQSMFLCESSKIFHCLYHIYLQTESKSSRDAIPDRKSPKLVEKPSQVKERAVSPVFTAAFSSSVAPKSVDTITKTSALELVETVEELSSGSFQEHSRDEQLDAGMVESLTDLNSSELFFFVPG